MTQYGDRMQRRVDVYLPAPGDKERWRKIAADRGMTLSKWIIAVVEEVLQQNEGAGPRGALLKEVGELKEEIPGLRERNGLECRRD